MELWQEAMTHVAIEKDDSIYQKWVFFEACLQFTERDFEQSLVLLRKSRIVRAEKNGFLVEHKLLTILNLIELKEYELLDYKVEKFRELIELHNDKCPERIQGAVRFLRTLIKTKYDLQATCLQEYESLRLIMQEGKKHQIITLIDVIGWVESKVCPSKLRMVS
jgi:hypothetical protein